MRKILLVAAGLVLAAGSAWSQSRDRGDDDRGDWRDGRGGWHRDMDSRHSDRMRNDDDSSDDRTGGRAARFFLRSGDAQLRVVCGDRESTQSCVDAALRLFDRIQNQSGTTSRSPSTPGTPPSPQ